MKKIYACFCTDVIHEGHLNIIHRAKEYGEVIAGVLSDSAMIRYNRFPTVSFEERIKMLEVIPDISRVVVQNNIMYDEIIEELQPDYVIHGDNWNDGAESAIRNNVVAALKKLSDKLGGAEKKLIEVPYTYNAEIKKIDERIIEKLAMPEFRRGRLKKLLQILPTIKVIEVHSGITGLIAEKTVVAADDGLDQFDAMWISSLCDSTVRGKPDIELVDISSRIRTIDEVMDVTTKPIILDIDTEEIRFSAMKSRKRRTR